MTVGYYDLGDVIINDFYCISITNTIIIRRKVPNNEIV